MENKIKIDIVSDVVCPWCIVGYKRLEQAIKELGFEDKVNVEWHPFQLNPRMSSEGQELQEHINEKYGSTPEQGQRSRENLTTLGAELDFNFDFFDGMRIVNTREAHILLDYAKEKNMQTELNLRFIAAYFTERLDVSDRNVLRKELNNVGLNAEDAMVRLDDDKVQEAVQAKEDYWKKLGVSGVPTMVFHYKNALTGAQPVNVYKQVLTEMIEQL